MLYCVVQLYRQSISKKKNQSMHRRVYNRYAAYDSVLPKFVDSSTFHVAPLFGSISPFHHTSFCKSYHGGLYHCNCAFSPSLYKVGCQPRTSFFIIGPLLLTNAHYRFELQTITITPLLPFSRSNANKPRHIHTHTHTHKYRRYFIHETPNH